MNAKLDGTKASNNWCDYPRFGFDSQAVYFTCNMFSFSGPFEYSKIRVMTKSQFVDNTALSYRDFWNLKEGDSSDGMPAFAIQPAQMFGATDSDGMYLISAHGGGGMGNVLDVWHLSGPQNCCNGGTDSPTLEWAGLKIGSFGPPAGAHQAGSKKGIDAGDSRLLYAIWKGGELSTGQSVACGSKGADSCASYIEVNVSDFPVVSTTNDWVYGAAGHDYYYPAVTVDSSGNKTMVFSESSSSEFAGVRYVRVSPSTTCSSCVDGPETILKDGQSYYNKKRWGDYFGASPDPNGTGIWVAGEFAAARNTWGVEIGLT
jgi:hypothetical protein